MDWFLLSVSLWTVFKRYFWVSNSTIQQCFLWWIFLNSIWLQSTRNKHKQSSNYRQRQQSNCKCNKRIWKSRTAACPRKSCIQWRKQKFSKMARKIKRRIIRLFKRKNCSWRLVTATKSWIWLTTNFINWNYWQDTCKVRFVPTGFQKFWRKTKTEKSFAWLRKNWWRINSYTWILKNQLSQTLI